MVQKNTIKEKKGLTVLKPGDHFRFECRQEFDCFTRCCRDITIALTPYDVIRMKNALGIPSGEFLERYTLIMIGDTGMPMVMLRMNADEEKRCPFVTDQGCIIYPDRPWSCRIYPLQPESTKITETAGKQYYSVLDIPFCHGLKSDRSRALAEWIEEQGISIYQETEAPFKKITTNEILNQNKITNQQIQDMLYMACFDLDRFKRFVMESTFLDRFDVGMDVVEEIKEDDVALYHFAMRWLEYGLLGQHVLNVKPEVMAAKKDELNIK